MDIVRWLILTGLFTFFFGIYQAAHAACLDLVRMDLSGSVLEKGYTVKSVDRQLWVPIFPGQFDRPVTVNISKIENIDEVPENFEPLSGFFQVEIEDNHDGLFVYPVMLSFAFQGDQPGDKAIYYFDQNNNWRKLPSKITDKKNKIIQAWTFLPKLKVAVFNVKQDELTAKSVMVWDEQAGQVVYAKDSTAIRPLASLTKLMTAAVFLQHNPGWDKEMDLAQIDFVGGSTLWAKVGSRFTIKDLFYAMMVGSKNNAAEALVRSTGLSQAEFVAEMNRMAEAWELKQTHFVDPSGISEANVSTAKEVAILADKAFANSDIKEASITLKYNLKDLRTNIYYPVENTSLKVLQSDLHVLGSKTGTNGAGANLVTKASYNGRELIAAVLGCHKTKNQDEIYQLLKYNF